MGEAEPGTPSSPPSQVHAPPTPLPDPPPGDPPGAGGGGGKGGGSGGGVAVPPPPAPDPGVFLPRRLPRLVAPRLGAPGGGGDPGRRVRGLGAEWTIEFPPYGRLKLFRERLRMYAYCYKHGGACNISRSIRGGAYKGKCAAILLAWLQHCPEGLTEWEHINQWQPSFAQREAIRRLWKNDARTRTAFEAENPEATDSGEVDF